MEFLSTNDIIMWIDNWASNNPHPQKDGISLFAKNLNEQIAKMDYKVPNGGTVIGYAGKINENDGKTAIFHTVESAVKNNDGKLCFINNSAENILNYEYFDEHGQSQTLWNSIDAVLPEGYVELIFKGGNYNVEGKRLTECYPGTMCLMRFVL